MFIRGDVNGDGKVNVSDPIALADYISGARQELPELDAADVNDDGRIDTGDLTTITSVLYQKIGSIPPPYPVAGRDPTPDAIPITGCPK